MEATRGKPMEEVFVCGAGHQGLSMAAHLSKNGVSVTLWNRTAENIREVIETGVIHCTGVVSGDAKVRRASSDIKDVVRNLVMVTTPSTAHKDIARLLAPYVNPEMCIVLNPGRTFGAIAFAEELKKNGVEEIPLIAETQTIVYTCRKSRNNSVTIFALKDQVGIASLRGTNVETVISRIPECLQEHFCPLDSVAYTSFSNVGMVLHCAPTLMNVGWIESEKADFKYYYDGISSSVSLLLEQIDKERLDVAKATGYKVDKLIEWIRKSYGVIGNSIFDCIRNNKAYSEIDAPPSVRTRYIFEDVPNGLVPIESIGKQLGIDTPIISSIITIASSVMSEDYRITGRTFDLDLLRKYF